MVGNYKFKLSDMFPSAWLFKLVHMTKERNPNHSSHSRKGRSKAPSSSSTIFITQSNPRESYYFTRKLKLIPGDDESYGTSPTKRKVSESDCYTTCGSGTPSSQQGVRRTSVPSPSTTSKLANSSVSRLNTSPEIRTDGVLSTESFDDMVVDLDEYCDAFPELELPPIVTRKQRIAKEEMKSIKDKEQRHIGGRRLSASSRGVKLRTKSPKISNMSKVEGVSSRKRVSSSRRNRSLSDGYAVVKSSSDPQRDFRDSMVEMIVENNIRTSKDLEDLLACYLSLNSDEYHDLIIKVFKQLWFDLVDSR